MPVELQIFVKEGVKSSQEYTEIDKIAIDLLEYFNQKNVIDKIEKANQPNANSKEIQDIFLPKTTELGFRSEAKGLFSKYRTSALRPDYYKKISVNSGIILEVERGKTLMNNMDMLDVWKCHICVEANYLFLIVPKNIKRGNNKNEVVYEKVKDRLQSFFIKDNYINVNAIFIFGY
jgi:hypothetical protein